MLTSRFTRAAQRTQLLRNLRSDLLEQATSILRRSTLSGRAQVVRVADGAELRSAVHPCTHAVGVDERLPVSGKRLPPEWALRVPSDYVDLLHHAVPAAIRDAGVDPVRRDRGRDGFHGLHNGPDQRRCPASERGGDSAPDTPLYQVVATLKRRGLQRIAYKPVRTAVSDTVSRR